MGNGYKKGEYVLYKNKEKKKFFIINSLSCNKFTNGIDTCDLGISFERHKQKKMDILERRVNVIISLIGDGYEEVVLNHKAQVFIRDFNKILKNKSRIKSEKAKKTANQFKKRFREFMDNVGEGHVATPTNKNLKSIKKNTKAKELHIYVDGSYNPIKDIMSYGVVIKSNNNKNIDNSFGLIQDFHYLSSILSEYNVSSQKISVNSKMSNSRFAEIGASIIGIDKAIKIGANKAYLYYDFNGIHLNNEQMEKAKKRKDGLNLVYANFLEAITNKITIKFIKVKTKKNPVHNQADKLAKIISIGAV